MGSVLAPSTVSDDADESRLCLFQTVPKVRWLSSCTNACVDSISF